jgi:hypothetical protein
MGVRAISELTLCDTLGLAHLCAWLKTTASGALQPRKVNRLWRRGLIETTQNVFYIVQQVPPRFGVA